MAHIDMMIVTIRSDVIRGYYFLYSFPNLMKRRANSEVTCNPAVIMTIYGDVFKHNFAEHAHGKKKTSHVLSEWLFWCTHPVFFQLDMES